LPSHIKRECIVIINIIFVLQKIIPSHWYSVEAINQSLVDDGLVDKEKIGGSNYFWSFPAKKDRLMELQHQKAIEHIETFKKTITETEAALMDAKRGREETDPSDDNNDDPAAAAGGGTGGGTTGGTEEPEKEPLPTRAKKLARLAEIAKDKSVCGKELEGLRENDPQVLANLEKELHLVLQYVTNTRRRRKTPARC
jgi:Mnd1 HTH domain